MLKTILLLTLMVTGTQKACKKGPAPATAALPDCIAKKIDVLRTEPPTNPRASVTEYVYSGKRVYAFNPGCCDKMVEVYDGSCEYVCAPSGGLTGKGDDKCTDFTSKAREVRTVWKDDR